MGKPETTRPTRQSLIMLQQNNDSLHMDLTSLITESANLDPTNANILLEFAENLKKTSSTYIKANRELVNHHLRHGNTFEANEIRKNRYSIHTDAQQSINFINQWLMELNCDGVSNLGSVSHQSIYLGASEQTGAVQKIPSHLHGINIQSQNSTPVPVPESFPSTTKQILERIRANRLNSRCDTTNLPDDTFTSNYIPSACNTFATTRNLPSNPVMSSLNQAHSHNHVSPVPKTILTTQYISPIVSSVPLNHHVSFVPKYKSEDLHPSIPVTTRQENLPVNRVETPSNPLNIHVPPSYMHEGFHASPSPPNFPPINVNLPDNDCLEPSVRHRLKADLLSGLGDPFTGSPEFFFQWKAMLQRRIEECKADSLDSLQIIIANTSGRVKDAVQKYTTAGIFNPDSTLKDVWMMLKERYGNDDLVASTVERKLRALPRVKDNDIFNLEQVLDFCRVASSVMLGNSQLSYLNSIHGINIILEKLPKHMFYKWLGRHKSHKTQTGNNPDFCLLVEFLADLLSEMNLPYLKYDLNGDKGTKGQNNVGRKTFFTQTSSHDSYACAYHQSNTHKLVNCNMFKSLSYGDRKKVAIDNRLCFNCLDPHKASECPHKGSDSLRCDFCKFSHVTAMHREFQGSERHPTPNSSSLEPTHSARSGGQGRSSLPSGKRVSGGQQGTRSVHFQVSDEPTASGNQVSCSSEANSHRNACVALCGQGGKPRVCSKTVSVDIQFPGSSKVLRCLCIIDEQSNASFCDERVVDYLEVPTQLEDYSLSTLNGKINVAGKSVEGLEIKGISSSNYFKLPPLLTHPDLPDTRQEAATSNLVKSFPHLAKYSHRFPDSVENLEVLLLLGADCEELMQSRSLGRAAPYIHETPLGFAVVGPVCLGSHSPKGLHRTLCTTVNSCSSSVNLYRKFIPNYSRKILESPFELRDDDDIPGMSQENVNFMDIISNGITVNSKGNLEMPLPLKPTARLPDNRGAVYFRTLNTLMRLKRDKVKLEGSLRVFGEYLAAGHVEEVPRSNSPLERSCYLAIFPIYNAHKKKTRLVLDPSATVKGKCLNDALFHGPDETNKLLGVLMRFRHGEIGFSADVEKMFHAFYVRPEDRDLLRFFWFHNNDPQQEVVEYRSNVMIFGSKASPSCATFGLRYATLGKEGDDHPKSRHFLTRNVYVDDCLGSADSVSESIEILSGSITILGKYNIHLHKLCSSSNEVLQAFPHSELSEVAISPGVSSERTLGLVWSPIEDTLSLASTAPSRPFSRRGLLGIINSIYDPLGLACPAVLKGKLLMREAQRIKGKSIPQGEAEWDIPLPDELLCEWTDWVDSLNHLSLIKVPRCHKPNGFGRVKRYELHCFSDASKDAIGLVLYLRCINDLGKIALAFIHGSSKVCPRSADTIPRLELCACMDAVRVCAKLKREIGLPIEEVFFYTDSLIVLGYLRNATKQFSRYVGRRIEEILKYSSVQQWSHISGVHNVSDLATRPQSPAQLSQSKWLTGPEFLWQGDLVIPTVDTPHPELPESMEPRVMATRKYSCTLPSPMSKIAAYTNSWTKALIITQYWIQFCRILSRKGKYHPIEARNKAKLLMLKEAQLCFSSKMDLIKMSKLPLNDSLSSINPFIDEHGLLRVGGRLKLSNFPPDVAHPIILPRAHRVTAMIIGHYHAAVSHQGRVMTLGAIREAGFHIQYASKTIKSFLKDCIMCRRLRGKTQNQIMADLPADRLSTLAPFSHVGVDIFGPYLVHDGKHTRRTNATKKVWGLIITCLASRANHVEIVSSMDTSAFLLALRRFFAVRGTCISIRSDQGSNFIGAINQSVDLELLQRSLVSKGVRWKLNPPLSSNYGGIWERKIGAIKSVFNATLATLGRHTLSRDEFTTILLEATCIVNNTPLWNVSSDPDDPSPLSPASLLTLKDDPNPPPPESFSSLDLLEYGKRRWRRVMYLADQFWVRWKRYYISELQERKRWKQPNVKISLGDLVLLTSNCKRNEWPMGRVIRTQVGSDGLVRRVWVKLGARGGRDGVVLERSVRDTVFLMPSSESEP